MDVFVIVGILQRALDFRAVSDTPLHRRKIDILVNQALVHALSEPLLQNQVQPYPRCSAVGLALPVSPFILSWLVALTNCGAEAFNLFFGYFQ